MGLVTQRTRIFVKGLTISFAHVARFDSRQVLLCLYLPTFAVNNSFRYFFHSGRLHRIYFQRLAKLIHATSSHHITISCLTGLCTGAARSFSSVHVVTPHRIRILGIVCFQSLPSIRNFDPRGS